MIKTEICDPKFGKIIRAQSDGGLDIYIMEKPEFTTAHAIFATRYGSIDTCFSTDGENYISVPEGIAHFLEHKLFESEEGDAFSRFAKTGAYCNAYTTFDRTCYLFNCSNNFWAVSLFARFPILLLISRTWLSNFSSRAFNSSLVKYSLTPHPSYELAL